MPETSVDVIKRYLDDAIAAGKSFEQQLEDFAKQSDDPVSSELFKQHAIETKSQYERLTERLSQLEGSPSTTKSLIANLFNFGARTLQPGSESAERLSQNLMVSFAVENSELAMYESLANIADAAGDTETAALARSIQAQERASAARTWELISETTPRPGGA